MKYVYTLKSISNVDRFYVGITDDVDKRVKAHNDGIFFAYPFCRSLWEANER
ncbi:MAG TPA: GIY-YIG nuclease family protein [Alphaproteobacteria bacterium]